MANKEESRFKLTIITVPDSDDSIVRYALHGESIILRFTYNYTAKCWCLGVYDSEKKPISIGNKIVKNFPINVFSGTTGNRDVSFVATCKNQTIERSDFAEGKAIFTMIS